MGRACEGMEEGESEGETAVQCEEAGQWPSVSFYPLVSLEVCQCVCESVCGGGGVCVL